MDSLPLSPVINRYPHVLLNTAKHCSAKLVPRPFRAVQNFFWLLLHSQTKKLGHEASSPLPPLSMLTIRCFFPFLSEKTRYFPTLIRGDGGYVIQLKCPNYFWPGL